ncbi:MAG: 50S ribosomal protein L1 [bacterium]|nr:50S ribosomal protein L1 [bacterium]
MRRMSKRHKENVAKVEPGKRYTLKEAVDLALSCKHAKFPESVDVHVLLGVDPKKADQAVRGTVVLPHGTGKKTRVCVFCTGADAEAAKEAGADYVGMDDLVKKVQEGWTDFDIAIATPATMREVGKLGKVLGPRGLMPSPKAGTVTTDVATAVKEFKAGKVEFRVDKQAGVNCSVGKTTFTREQLVENIQAFMSALLKAKPAAAKGTYLVRVSLSTTMGPGVRIDTRDIERMAAT